jgi:hypothetical protein
MTNEIRKIIGCAGLSLLVAGCATNSDPASENVTTARAPVVIVKERSFANCPKFIPVKTFRIVSDAQAWNEHRRSAVLVPNDLAQWNPDFSQSTMLMLSLGQDQTDGSRVYAAPGIKRVGDELLVPVVISKSVKNAGAASAQMVPCMYLQVTGADYKVISVLDKQSGQVMFKSAL